jgi:hypothetical protein
MKYYILAEEKLRDLLRDKLRLKALNYVGVSAWVGYREACEKYIDSENDDFNIELSLKDYKSMESLDIETSVKTVLNEMQRIMDKQDVTIRKYSENILYLREAIRRAVSFLACMDGASDDGSSVQFPMDILSEALGETK